MLTLIREETLGLPSCNVQKRTDDLLFVVHCYLNFERASSDFGGTRDWDTALFEVEFLKKHHRKEVYKPDGPKVTQE